MQVLCPELQPRLSELERKSHIVQRSCHPERLAPWAQAIPRKDQPPTFKDAVCTKHFTEDMLLRSKFYGELKGELVLDHPKRSEPLPHAVPSIFPLWLS